MEKSEGRKQGSSPGSSSRRTYSSLFSSIINLSSAPGEKTTDGASTTQQSPHTIPITRTNPPQKLSSNAPKKKKSNQSSSPSQSIASPRTGVNGPMGSAPRTLSILTALNELAISDRAGFIDSNPQDHHHQDEMSRGLSEKEEEQGDNNNHHRNSRPYPRLNPSHHHSLVASQLKSDDLSSAASFSSSSIPRKLKGQDRSTRQSPSSSSSHSRAKSRERTPDWIWRIFQLAKHGRLDELQKSLKGLDPLDPTLIRHLVDEKGNTLLHCAARRGHVHTLQWLVSILGSHTKAVLYERNRAGRNVILTALKGGQLKCFQWLVLQSISGDKALLPKEGERSLLHFAANYGYDPAVRWLVEQFKKRNVPVDVKDSSGMTPLHMAGKSGSISVCHTLIVIAGADPFCQTELGGRASDLALRHRHMKCANYLLMAEAASSLGSQLSSLLSLYKNLQEEHESLRFHFREVLRVGKSLVKERVDLIKSFPSAGSKSSPEAELLLGGANSNGARLSGLEHKLVIAEQAWKRMEQNQVDKFPGNVTNLASVAASVINNGGGLETPPLDVDFSLENINSVNLLQKRLAGLQSRQDKNFASEALLSASSSDTESTVSAASSNNDDQKHNRHYQDYHSQSRKQGSSSQQSFNLSESSRASTTTTAPWLLPPDDTLLSALSPIVSQIDGTVQPSSSTEFIPSLDLIQKGPSTTAILYSSTGTFGKAAVGKSQGSETNPPTTTPQDKGIDEKVVEKVEPPSATVLEVIEPPNKKGEDEAGKLLVSSFPSWRGSKSSSGSHGGPNSVPGVMRGGRGGLGNGGGRRQVLILTESFQSPPRPPTESQTKRLVGEGPVESHETMKESLSYSIEHEKKQSWRNRRRAKSRREDDKSLSSPLPCSSSVVATKHISESVYFTPDLIRGTRHKPSYHGKSDELAWNSSPNRSTSSIYDVEDIYSQIAPLTEDEHSNMRQTYNGSKDAPLTSPSPTKTKSWHPSPSSSMVKSATSPTTSLRNSPRVFLQSNQFLMENVGDESGSDCKEASRNGQNITSSFLYGPLSKSSPSASSLHLASPTCFPSELTRKSEEIYGKFLSNKNKLENNMCTETDVTCPSAENGSESVSSLNAPVIKRSLSSVSRVSATVEFTCRHKIPWASTDQLNFTTLESNLAGPSPTPSESSRTESALVPPSHTSQISELSKTESASEPILSHYNLDHSLSNEDQEGDSGEIIPIDPLFSPTDNLHNFSRIEKTGEDYESRGERDEYSVDAKAEGGKSLEGGGSKGKGESTVISTENGPDVGESEERDKIGKEARQRSKSHSANSVSQIVSAPSITRSGGSTGIHKATIQRVTKSTRGPPKPWYEIEGSDEEGSHLLQIARTSRSSCLSTSSFSDTENEPTDDDHTCTPDCTQNNCPNCV